MLGKAICALAALLVLVAAIRMIVVGRTDSYYGEKFTASRATEPFSFWTLVLFYLGLAAVLGWLALG
jgi:hypothetical protein